VKKHKSCFVLTRIMLGIDIYNKITIPGSAIATILKNISREIYVYWISETNLLYPHDRRYFSDVKFIVSAFSLVGRFFSHVPSYQICKITHA
jgi:hypothetical protein